MRRVDGIACSGVLACLSFSHLQQSFRFAVSYVELIAVNPSGFVNFAVVGGPTALSLQRPHSRAPCLSRRLARHSVPTSDAPSHSCVRPWPQSPEESSQPSVTRQERSGSLAAYVASRSLRTPNVD